MNFASLIIEQELRDRGMIYAIYPIFMGDKDANDTYTNYFRSGCHPNLSGLDTVVVEKIEEKLFEHLSNQGLSLHYSIHAKVISMQCNIFVLSLACPFQYQCIQCEYGQLSVLLWSIMYLLLP